MLLAASGSAIEENKAETDLLAKLESIRQRNSVAAFGLVVVENDTITVLSAKGIANRVSDEPIGTNAIFRIGSVSKMFAGLLAATLESRQVLRLDDPIERWPVAGTYSNSWSTSRPIYRWATTATASHPSPIGTKFFGPLPPSIPRWKIAHA